MKKNIVLAVIATAAMALSLVGCGVKVTNISVPDAATLEKGESITLPVNFGTEDAPAETPVIATGESATAETAAQDEKIAKAAEKLTLAWTSSDESVATVDETGTVTAVAAGEAEITAAVKDTEMQDVCVITVKVSANPEPAQPSNPEPSQPSGGDSGSTENKPNGSGGWEWGGPVISTPTDNGCPPEEHAGGLC